MSKKKVVTSSMAVALAMCSATGSFAEASQTDVTEATPKVEVKATEQVEDVVGEEEKPTEDTDSDSSDEKEEAQKPSEEVQKPSNGGKPTADGMIEYDEYFDNTNVGVQGGFYLYVNHYFGNTSSKFKDIIPTMTFELLDANGKSLGTAVASESNYKKGEGYLLHFKNVPEFRKGDKFRLKLKSSDAIVSHINMVYTDNFTEEDKDGDGEADFDLKDGKLTNGKDILFSVGIGTGSQSKGDKWIDEVEGSKNAPYSVTMQTDSSKVGVKVVTEDNKPVANKKFEIERTYDKSKFTATTDNKGVLWLDRTKVQPVIEVASTDSKYEFDGWEGKAEIILPINSVEQELDDFLSTTIVLKEAKAISEGEVVGVGKISTTMKINGNTDISTDWTKVDIELKDTKTGATFDYTIDKDTKELDGILDGTYVVSVKSTAAKVDMDKKITVKNGKGNLSLTVSPNHILEVIKRVDGKNTSYNFSVINASDKSYKGTNAIRFGVTPGDTFMVKDNDTEEVFNVTISDKMGVTKLVLGEGVVLSADGTSPHTRDMSPLYVSMLGASLIVVGVMAYKMSDDKRRAMKTLMMLGVIAGSMLATTPEVFAGAGGGTGSGPGGIGGNGGWLTTTNGSTNVTTIDGSPVTQVIQFGFVPTQYILPDGSTYTGMNLTEDGTESDLASAYKFTSDALKYALYMPLNDATNKDFRASGVLDFDGKTSKYYLIRGKNRLYNKIPTQGITYEKDDVISYRTVEKPSVAKTRNNFALQIMGSVLEPAEKSSKGVFEVDYGTALNKKIKSLTEDEKDLFFNDYLILLGTRGINVEQLKEDYAQGKVTFVAQTLLRVHKGSDKANGMYISVHSLARALGVGEGKSDQIYSRERRYLLTRTGGYCTVGTKGCSKTKCKAVGHASYGTWRYTRDGYSKTIQAITEPKVEGVAPVKLNTFGGWGFFHWKDSKKDSTADPKITVKSVIDLYDEDGKKVGTTTTVSDKVNKTSISKQILFNIAEYKKSFTIAPGVITHNGKKYQVVKEETNKVELKDIKDNKSLYSPTLDGKTEAKPSINIPLSGGNGSDVKTYLADILDVHSPSDINTHLGGSEEEGKDANDANNDFDMGDGSNPTVINKYKGQVDDKGNPVYSNAEATVYLKAVEITDTVTQKYEVPQWRLSRYWSDVADKTANATYELINPGGDEGHATSTVSPNGVSQLKLQPVDVSKSPWLKTEPKWKSNLNYVNVPTDGGASLSTPVGGTLLATKTSKDIDNVNFANWKGVGYTNEINSADKGNTNYKYKNSVTKTATLKYYMKDPKTYTHNRAVYKHSSRWVSTGNGDGYSVDVCNCYTTGEGMAQTYAPATYKIDMTYYRHHPSAKATVKLAGEKGKYEAFSWETKQTPTLKVYPEVVMANSDLSGRNNVSIVAGDLHREVTPLSYHFLQLDAEVGSKVVGTSVATDVKAQSLIQNVVNSNGGVSVTQGGAQVIHKGSATNTSYTLKGSSKGIKQDKATLTAKTFAVDIGNTALKNSWNPGTTYNTDKVNEDYLSQFGTKEGNNWKFTAKFQPGLKIGANEYKGKSETQHITGIPQATKEYSLVVRSGKLTLVSGKKPTALTDELKTALERMKLTGTNKTVLDVFEYNQGAKLTEAEVAKLMNAIRGTDEIKVGGNWYHEDTTVLVVREYTTIFDLPSAYMYSDKIQMQIPSLDSPIDKTQFYTKGLPGHTTLEIGIDKSDVTLKYDSSIGQWAKDNKKEMQYVVPNVSILDTTK